MSLWIFNLRLRNMAYNPGHKLLNYLLGVVRWSSRVMASAKNELSGCFPFMLYIPDVYHDYAVILGAANAPP